MTDDPNLTAWTPSQLDAALVENAQIMDAVIRARGAITAEKKRRRRVAYAQIHQKNGMRK